LNRNIIHANIEAAAAGSQLSRRESTATRDESGDM
jgi:hypothetical protein